MDAPARGFDHVVDLNKLKGKLHSADMTHQMSLGSDMPEDQYTREILTLNAAEVAALYYMMDDYTKEAK